VLKSLPDPTPHLTLQVPDEILEALVTLVDSEDMDCIKYADFARVMLSDDILKLVAEWRKENQKRSGLASPRRPSLPSDPRSMIRMQNKRLFEQTKSPILGEKATWPPKLRRTVAPAEVRSAQKQLVEALKRGKKTIAQAFAAVDEDGSGELDRNEAMKMMKEKLPHVREAVLATLCDFVDKNCDGRIDLGEFERLFYADDVLSVLLKPPKVDF